MISNTRIALELDRCLTTRYHITLMYADAVLKGYLRLIHKYCKDAMTLYALEKSLYNAITYGFTETEIEQLIFTIREYLMALNISVSLDYFSKYNDMLCRDIPVGPNIPYILPGTPGQDGRDGIPGADGQDGEDGTPTTIINNTTVIDNTTWHSQNLTPKITVDGQTTITGINFNIANVDVDTVLLEVQGDDPKYTTEGEGFHMVGNTLYWHHFYDLKVGMQVKIRWREE